MMMPSCAWSEHARSQPAAAARSCAARSSTATPPMPVMWPAASRMGLPSVCNQRQPSSAVRTRNSIVARSRRPADSSKNSRLAGERSSGCSQVRGNPRASPTRMTGDRGPGRIEQGARSHPARCRTTVRACSRTAAGSVPRCRRAPTAGATRSVTSWTIRYSSERPRARTGATCTSTSGSLPSAPPVAAEKCVCAQPPPPRSGCGARPAACSRPLQVQPEQLRP